MKKSGVKIELLVKGDNDSKTLFKYDNADIELSGNYLIISEFKSINDTTSERLYEVWELSKIIKYKIRESL